MNLLEITRLPAPYSFERNGGSPGRTPESRDCVSVSTIKSYLAQKFKLDNYEPDFGSESMSLKAWLGLALEDRLALDLACTEPDRMAWPGELFTPSGGVMGHPEGYYFASGGLQIGDVGVDEFKHTYTSCRNYTEEEIFLEAKTGMLWHYQFQLKSYVAMLRAAGQECYEGRLFVLAAVGNWTDEREPVLSMARVSWEPKELDNQILMLERDAKRAWDWKNGGGK